MPSGTERLESLVILVVYMIEEVKIRKRRYQMRSRSVLYRLIKANGDDDTFAIRASYIFMILAVLYLSGHIIYYLVR